MTGDTASPERVRPLVLVVDDDDDVRRLAHVHLSTGFDVIQASDGPTCIDLARRQSPDVILLDMMMPEMGGVEVLESLGGDPRTESIPVIVLSGLAEVEHRVAGLEGGAVDHISKPADAQELLARVGAAARTKARVIRRPRAKGEDPLTGLGDKSAFRRRMGEEHARAIRGGSSLAVLLIDVDGMDSINALRGREGGDRVLKSLSEHLSSTLRVSDSVFRVGPDEFAALLPDTDLPTAQRAAERVGDGLAGMANLEDVTLSIGISDFAPGHGPDEALVKAEAALLKARDSGGNRVWRADDPRRKAISPQTLCQDLTQREWAVLTHLARRGTEQEIARRLGIKPGTVRSHKARIRRKLHVAPNERLADFARMNFRDLISDDAETGTGAHSE